EVEQYEVGSVAVELVDGRGAVVGDGHVVPLPAEQVGQRVAERVFVLDDEDAGHAGLSFWLFTASAPSRVPGVVTGTGCGAGWDPCAVSDETVDGIGDGPGMGSGSSAAGGDVPGG